MVKIYFVRHGKTKANIMGTIMGHIDSEIPKENRNKIKAFAKKLKKINFDIIYSSSIGRAYKTAKIISKEIGFEGKIIKRDDLKEINYGKFARHKKKNILESFPRYHTDARFINPGGESFNQLYTRISKFIKNISKKEGNILVVTHAGCIRAAWSYFNDQKIQDNINMKLNHDFIIKCTINNEKKSVELL